MPVIRAWANGLRTNDRVRDAVAVEVVDEGALTQQELLVLDPAYLCPKDAIPACVRPYARTGDALR